MNREEIIDKLREMFMKRLNIHLDGKNFSEPLLGLEWNLLASDLVYVFFDLEKIFEIQITEKDIDDESLFSIESIINLIIRKESVV